MYVAYEKLNSMLGIPTIFTYQHYQTARYLNMTTIATFLSGVTVSMIQLSSSQSTNAIDTATNALFFTSLVFSTCSAVTSLLVMSWRSSNVYGILIVKMLCLNVEC